MTALYRFFNKEGELLYIGISLNPFIRMLQHCKAKYWYRSVSRVEIGNYENRLDAEIAERDAIILEVPKYNIEFNHNKGIIIDNPNSNDRLKELEEEFGPVDESEES